MSIHLQKYAFHSRARQSANAEVELTRINRCQSGTMKIEPCRFFWLPVENSMGGVDISKHGVSLSHNIRPFQRSSPPPSSSRCYTRSSPMDSTISCYKTRDCRLQLGRQSTISQKKTPPMSRGIRPTREPPSKFLTLLAFLDNFSFDTKLLLTRTSKLEFFVVGNDRVDRRLLSKCLFLQELIGFGKFQKVSCRVRRGRYVRMTLLGLGKVGSSQCGERQGGGCCSVLFVQQAKQGTSRVCGDESFALCKMEMGLSSPCDLESSLHDEPSRSRPSW